ncbi:MAG: hypothetical protein QXO40_00230 [Candidatus Aenigmatarchaeota archaeon]
MYAQQPQNLEWWQITIEVLKQAPYLIQTIKDTIDILKGKKSRTTQEEQMLTYLQQLLEQYQKEKEMEKIRHEQLMMLLIGGMIGIGLLLVFAKK